MVGCFTPASIAIPMSMSVRNSQNLLEAMVVLGKVELPTSGRTTSRGGFCYEEEYVGDFKVYVTQASSTQKRNSSNTFLVVCNGR